MVVLRLSRVPDPDQLHPGQHHGDGLRSCPIPAGGPASHGAGPGCIEPTAHSRIRREARGASRPGSRPDGERGRGPHRAAVPRLSEQSRAGDKIVSAHEGATAADLENERQLNGVDASRGDGPLAKDAAKRRELAAEQARFLEAHQKDLAQDAARLSEQIAAAENRLAQARPHYAEAERKLENERDGRLAKATGGPLTAVRGLIKLRHDPEQGAAVALVTVLSWSGIMVLELAFFLARTLFKPASVHDLAVNTDVKKPRAALLAHEFTEVLATRTAAIPCASSATTTLTDKETCDALPTDRPFLGK